MKDATNTVAKEKPEKKSTICSFFWEKRGDDITKTKFVQLWDSLAYRTIPKISLSMYKPLQIYVPQTGNAKNPPLNRSSKYKAPRGLYLENYPQIQSKTK